MINDRAALQNYIIALERRIRNKTKNTKKSSLVNERASRATVQIVCSCTALKLKAKNDITFGTETMKQSIEPSHY